MTPVILPSECEITVFTNPDGTLSIMFSKPLNEIVLTLEHAKEVIRLLEEKMARQN